MSSSPAKAQHYVHFSDSDVITDEIEKRHLLALIFQKVLNVEVQTLLFRHISINYDDEFNPSNFLSQQKMRQQQQWLLTQQKQQKGLKGSLKGLNQQVNSANSGNSGLKERDKNDKDVSIEGENSVNNNNKRVYTGRSGVLSDKSRLKMHIQKSAMIGAISLRLLLELLKIIDPTTQRLILSRNAQANEHNTTGISSDSSKRDGKNVSLTSNKAFPSSSSCSPSEPVRMLSNHQQQQRGGNEGEKDDVEGEKNEENPLNDVKVMLAFKLQLIPNYTDDVEDNGDGGDNNNDRRKGGVYISGTSKGLNDKKGGSDLNSPRLKGQDASARETIRRRKKAFAAAFDQHADDQIITLSVLQNVIFSPPRKGEEELPLQQKIKGLSLSKTSNFAQNYASGDFTVGVSGLNNFTLNPGVNTATNTSTGTNNSTSSTLVKLFPRHLNFLILRDSLSRLNSFVAVLTSVEECLKVIEFNEEPIERREISLREYGDAQELFSNEVRRVLIEHRIREEVRVRRLHAATTAALGDNINNKGAIEAGKSRKAVEAGRGLVLFPPQRDIKDKELDKEGGEGVKGKEEEEEEEEREQKRLFSLSYALSRTEEEMVKLVVDISQKNTVSGNEFDKDRFNRENEDSYYHHRQFDKAAVTKGEGEGLKENAVADEIRIELKRCYDENVGKIKREITEPLLQRVKERDATIKSINKSVAFIFASLATISTQRNVIIDNDNSNSKGLHGIHDKGIGNIKPPLWVLLEMLLHVESSFNNSDNCDNNIDGGDNFPRGENEDDGKVKDRIIVFFTVDFDEIFKSQEYFSSSLLAVINFRKYFAHLGYLINYNADKSLSVASSFPTDPWLYCTSERVDVLNDINKVLSYGNGNYKSSKSEGALILSKVKEEIKKMIFVIFSDLFEFQENQKKTRYQRSYHTSPTGSNINKKDEEKYKFMVNINFDNNNDIDSDKNRYLCNSMSIFYQFFTFAKQWISEAIKNIFLSILSSLKPAYLGNVTVNNISVISDNDVNFFSDPFYISDKLSRACTECFIDDNVNININDNVLKKDKKGGIIDSADGNRGGNNTNCNDGKMKISFDLFSKGIQILIHQRVTSYEYYCHSSSFSSSSICGNGSSMLLPLPPQYVSSFYVVYRALLHLVLPCWTIYLRPWLLINSSFNTRLFRSNNFDFSEENNNKDSLDKYNNNNDNIRKHDREKLRQRAITQEQQQQQLQKGLGELASPSLPASSVSLSTPIFNAPWPISALVIALEKIYNSDDNNNSNVNYNSNDNDLISSICRTSFFPRYNESLSLLITFVQIAGNYSDLVKPALSSFNRNKINRRKHRDTTYSEKNISEGDDLQKYRSSRFFDCFSYLKEKDVSGGSNDVLNYYNDNNIGNNDTSGNLNDIDNFNESVGDNSIDLDVISLIAINFRRYTKPFICNVIDNNFNGKLIKNGINNNSIIGTKPAILKWMTSREEIKRLEDLEENLSSIINSNKNDNKFRDGKPSDDANSGVHKTLNDDNNNNNNTINTIGDEMNLRRRELLSSLYSLKKVFSRIKLLREFSVEEDKNCKIIEEYNYTIEGSSGGKSRSSPSSSNSSYYVASMDSASAYLHLLDPSVPRHVHLFNLIKGATEVIFLSSQPSYFYPHSPSSSSFSVGIPKLTDSSSMAIMACNNSPLKTVKMTKEIKGEKKPFFNDLPNIARYLFLGSSSFVNFDHSNDSRNVSNDNNDNDDNNNNNINNNNGNNNNNFRNKNNQSFLPSSVSAKEAILMDVNDKLLSEINNGSVPMTLICFVTTITKIYLQDLNKNNSVNKLQEIIKKLISGP